MSKQPTIDETRELLRNLSSTLAAELCGISPRHLRRLVNDEHLPRPVNGKVDAFEVLEDFRAYTENGSVSGELADVRKQIETERHRKLKLENDRRDESLVPVSDFHACTDAMSSIFAQGMESLPGRLATVLAGESEPAVIRKVLQDEVRRIRQSVSEAFEREAANQRFDPAEV